MNTTRLLISQADQVYRFLRFEQSSDGSVIVLVDRDPTPSTDRRFYQDGEFVKNPDNNQPVPHAKWTIHTTGQVNYHHGGVCESSFQVEPLYTVSKIATVAIVSIPRPERLDMLLEGHKHKVSGTIVIPSDLNDRLTFTVSVGPKNLDQDQLGNAWIITFEIYSLIVQVTEDPPIIAPNMADHFVYASPTKQGSDLPTVNPAQAEIKFYQSLTGHSGFHVFREESGAYVALASVEMRAPPNLSMVFDRLDLSAEPIPYAGKKEITHKVRFWIRDKGGRNKTDDLRGHITSIGLYARL